MSREAGVFPARMAALARVVELVEAVCAAAGFVRQDCFRLTLIVEELFTNTVRHGHGGDSDELVALAFEIQERRVVLTYEDTAPPYDPSLRARAPDITVQPGPRPEGGLGLALVGQMAEDLAYSRADGRNRLSLAVRARSAP